MLNTSSAYGPVTRFLHWLIFFLIFGMLFLGYFMQDIGDKPLRGDVVSLHKLIGLAILFVMMIRVVWALFNPKPLILDVPQWQRFLERLVHFTLYALIIAMPLSGWIGSVSAGYVPHLGNFQFNLPIEQNKELSKICFELHGIFAIAILLLVSFHVFAALYHHFVKRDNIYLRMIGKTDPNYRL